MGLSPSTSTQRVEQHLEAFAVVAGTEVVQPGLLGGLAVQGVDVELAAGGHGGHGRRISSTSGLNRGAARSSMWMASAIAGPPGGRGPQPSTVRAADRTRPASAWPVGLAASSRTPGDHDDIAVALDRGLARAARRAGRARPDLPGGAQGPRRRAVGGRGLPVPALGARGGRRRLPVRRSRRRPVFVDINTPTRRDRRWGGDNTDAYYAMVPIDPARTYRVTGQRGDSAYFSLTVYNEPSPGSLVEPDRGHPQRHRPRPRPGRRHLLVPDGPAAPGRLRRAVHRAQRRCRGRRDPRLPGRPERRPAGDVVDRGARSARPAAPPRRRHGRGPAHRCWPGCAPCSTSCPWPWRPRDETTLGPQLAPGGQPVRRALPGARRQLRLVGPRRLLRLRQLRPRARRGPGGDPSPAGLPVLEPGHLEPVHGRPQPG